MSNQDHKTKDFLQKIDSLIKKGKIKDHAEVVKTLTWNKSVMSSVKNGKLLVPLHIYNKFNDVYSKEIASLKEKNEIDHRDEQILFLKEQNQFLRERVLFLEKQVQTNLIDLKDNQFVIAARILSNQEVLIDQHPGIKKTDIAQLKKSAHKLMLLKLETFEKGGIRSEVSI